VCRALEKRGDDIIHALPASLTEMTFYYSTLDHPTLHPGNIAKEPAARQKWALPIFSWCAGPRAYDVPVPDYSFIEVPENANDGNPYVRRPRPC
jgi:Glycosyl transferase family 90